MPQTKYKMDLSKIFVCEALLIFRTKGENQRTAPKQAKRVLPYPARPKTSVRGLKRNLGHIVQLARIVQRACTGSIHYLQLGGCNTFKLRSYSAYGNSAATDTE